jgi:hypothetical protein
LVAVSLATRNKPEESHKPVDLELVDLVLLFKK